MDGRNELRGVPIESAEVALLRLVKSKWGRCKWIVKRFLALLERKLSKITSHFPVAKSAQIGTHCSMKVLQGRTKNDREDLRSKNELRENDLVSSSVRFQ